MAVIAIHQEKIDNHEELIELCPFDAIEVVSKSSVEDGNKNEDLIFGEKYLQINSGCKLCKLCVKKGPEGIFELIGDENEISIDKSAWQGIAVYVDHMDGDIHPVTLELIGKAKNMAEKISHPIYCIFMGHQITHKAYELIQYGVDDVFVYDHKELKDFRIEPYAACMEDFINSKKPSTILVGGTTIGRSLAPRVAARFRTGLTADCTILDIQENSDLDQIRPAFGGNIMAHIHTPNHRPQFATVRYKIFCTPETINEPCGRVTECSVPEEKLSSGIRVIDVKKKERSESIEDAEIIVVAGRDVISASEEYLGSKFPDDSADAYLLLSFDGANTKEVEKIYESVAHTCLEAGAIDVLISNTQDRQETIWTSRGAYLEAIKASTSEIDECDVVVPRNQVANFIKYSQTLEKEYNIRIRSFGHAGDGNLHIYVLKDDLPDHEWIQKREKVMDCMYEKAQELKGQVSGEHGIGFAKKSYLEKSLKESGMGLLRNIKDSFDPKNILNPGKICC